MTYPAAPIGTIQHVLNWVDGDPARAQLALDAERAGSNRSTLIRQLQAITSKQEDTVSHGSTETTGTTTETTETNPADDPTRTDQEGVTDNDQARDEEDTDLAPAPEPPDEIELYAEDAGTVIGPPHVRDADVEVPEDAFIVPDPASDLHPDIDKSRAQQAAFDPSADAPGPIEGEIVEILQGVSSTRALGLKLNGSVFLFDRQTVGALKQIVDQTVVGLAL